MFSTSVRENKFLDRLVMSVEANFHLHRFFNKQNYRFRSTRNPRAINDHQLLHIKCTVCCGVTAEGVIDSFFFHNDDGSAVTVTGERYTDIGQNYLHPVGQNKSQM